MLLRSVLFLALLAYVKCCSTGTYGDVTETEVKLEDAALTQGQTEANVVLAVDNTYCGYGGKHVGTKVKVCERPYGAPDPEVVVYELKKAKVKRVTGYGTADVYTSVYCAPAYNPTASG